MTPDHEQFDVVPFTDPNNPMRSANIVVGWTAVPGSEMTLNVSYRVQFVAWAGPGEPSFSDIQWLDEIRSLLAERMIER